MMMKTVKFVIEVEVEQRYAQAYLDLLQGRERDVLFLAEQAMRAALAPDDAETNVVELSYGIHERDITAALQNAAAREHAEIEMYGPHA